MNKGIVMEIKADQLIVMSVDGTFHAIPRSNRECHVGQEIIFADEPARGSLRKSLIWSSGVVAAAVFFLVAFIGMGGSFGNGRSEVVAYVSMDVNPSIEFGINSGAKVVEQRGLNADGERLVQQIDFSKKSLTDVTEIVLKRLDSTVFANRAEGNVLLAIAKVKEDSNLDVKQVVSNLEQQVEAHLRTTFPQKAIEVTAITAPKEAHDSANEKDLSMGKLAIYLKALENGQAVTLSEFQTKSVSEIAKTNGGIGKLIGNGNMKQDDILQLVKADRNGTLGNNQGIGSANSPGIKGNGSPTKSTSPTDSSKSTPTASPKSTVTPKTSVTSTPTLKNSVKPSLDPSSKSSNTPASGLTPTPSAKTTSSPKNNNGNSEDNKNNRND
jgi:hypothetical protein